MYHWQESDFIAIKQCKSYRCCTQDIDLNPSTFIKNFIKNSSECCKIKIKIVFTLSIPLHSHADAFRAPRQTLLPATSQHGHVTTAVNHWPHSWYSERIHQSNIHVPMDKKSRNWSDPGIVGTGAMGEL